MELHSTKIEETIATLSSRISERFAHSSLHSVSQDLLGIAQRAEKTTDLISKPILWLRIINFILIALVFTGLAGTIYTFETPEGGFDFFDLIQVLEAGINDVVLIGAGIFFLISIETRVKRKRALAVLHELRMIAHTIDLHQLQKDPERTLNYGTRTQSSPKDTMSAFELSRYLDYCSEMLSLTGKIAALYVKEFEDSVTLSAVNEIESLTTGLSRKIWQKIMILHSLRPKDVQFT